MKLTIIAVAVAGLTVCSNSKADCYVRSNIKLTRQAIVAGPTDVQKLVVPDSVGKKCVLRYRVYAGNQWQTAEGTGTGSNEIEACKTALDIGNSRLLAEVEPNLVRADTQMVCSDLPDIRVRPVSVGETVWESETDLHGNLQERKYFWYKHANCRWFQERNPKDGNMITYLGIMCQADGRPNSKWRILDKF